MLPSAKYPMFCVVFSASINGKDWTKQLVIQYDTHVSDSHTIYYQEGKTIGNIVGYNSLETVNFGAFKNV